MLKCKLLIILFCFLTTSISAQKNFRPNIGIGVHGGYGLADATFTPNIRTKLLENYSGGFLINYTPEKVLGVQVELNKVTRGWKEISDTHYFYSRKMDVLEIPFLTHLSIGNRLILFTIDFGPYISFNQGSREESLLPGNIGDSIIYDYFSNYTSINYSGQKPQSSFDYGFTGGIGFGFKVFGGDIQARFRYTQGLTHLFPRFPDGQYSISQLKSFYAGISYTYTIYFGPRNE